MIKSIQSTGKYFIHHADGRKNTPSLYMIETTKKQYMALINSEPVGKSLGTYGFGLASPIPRKPFFADYLWNTDVVVSNRFKDLIAEKVASSAEFVPASVAHKETVYDYNIIHSLKNHDVMDMEKSKYSVISFGDISWIDKLIINYEKLEKIPLEERLLFKIGRTPLTFLWHESLVKYIEESDLTGISFTPADEYSQDQIFDP